MKNKLFFSSLYYFVFCFNCSFAVEKWISDNPESFIMKIEIYENESISATFLRNSFVNITFNNGVEYFGIPLYVEGEALFFPRFLREEYYSYAPYYCYDSEEFSLFQICEALALRKENGQLCVGHFRFSSNQNVFVVNEIGCFRKKEIVTEPQFNLELSLQKNTKEQLIEMIMGRKPIFPNDPICLSCPPWKGYEKDLNRVLSSSKSKKYKVRVKGGK